jgi:alanine racemase
VTYLKKIGPGDSVSYHRRFTAQRETLVATLPLGYSDGYPAQAIGKAHALIGGRRWPLIAAVTANHITLDVTGAENIAIGDEVVLFGTQRGARLTLGELAEWAGSSVYRVAIGMSPLLPRILLDT